MAPTEHEEHDPQADFAEAVGNGQIHPAVAGMFAHLDNRLADILDAQAPKDEDDAQDDDDDRRPAQGDDDAARQDSPVLNDKATADKAGARKATPASVAPKGGNR